MMQQAKQEYTRRTGRDPSKLVLLGSDCLSDFKNLYKGLLSYSRIQEKEIRDEEFLEILRTPRGYRIRGVERHQEDSGDVLETYLEQEDIPEGCFGSALKEMEIGDQVVLHFSGKDLGDIARKRTPYLHPERVETPSTLENPVFYKINQTSQGHETWVKPENTHGIHARPAASIVKSMSKYSSEVFLENQGNRVSAKGTMGVLTLEAYQGTPLKATAIGTDSRQALEDLVELFQSKFDEE